VLDGRRDVLRFLTDPLAEDVEVIGPVRVTLHAATSAVDTDWTAKLVDVHPDGTALNVVDSIVRARYRDPSRGAQLPEPGRSHEVTIELGATAQLFAAGHRIRLDVSSSNFPRFDRNPGTGATTGSTAEADFVTAEQSVRHDPDHPSRLTLPAIGV
jgi:putative CocE/NonD family hydrolase